LVIGKHLRDLRTAKGLTQHDVEERTGMLCCYLSRIENGRTVPSVDTLEKLAAAYEIPLWKVFRDGRDRSKPFQLRSDRKESSPKDGQFLQKLAERLPNLRQRDLHLLLHMAQRMAFKGKRMGTARAKDRVAGR
jgi:transcriptional regulator with XRE-family HTH domain